MGWRRCLNQSQATVLHEIKMMMLSYGSWCSVSNITEKPVISEKQVLFTRHWGVGGSCLLIPGELDGSDRCVTSDVKDDAGLIPGFRVSIRTLVLFASQLSSNTRSRKLRSVSLSMRLFQSDNWSQEADLPNQFWWHCSCCRASQQRSSTLHRCTLLPPCVQKVVTLTGDIWGFSVRMEAETVERE